MSLRNRNRNSGRGSNYGGNGGNRNGGNYGHRNSYRGEDRGTYGSRGREYDEDYDIRAGRERGYSGEDEYSPSYGGRSYGERSNGERSYGGGRMRGALSRAGDRIRETWNDWTDRDERDGDYDRDYDARDYGRNIDEYDDRYSQRDRDYGDDRSHRGEGVRGTLRRAGDRIRETWNDWTDRDERGYRSDYENPYGVNQSNYNRYRDRRPYGEENEGRRMGRARRRVNAYTW